MERTASGGQAAVEWVGAVVVVALLVGALAAWLPAAVRAPDRPPDPVAAVAAPLGDLGRGIGEGVAGADLARLAAGVAPGAGAGRRAAAWIAVGARATAALARDMGVAFGGGFAQRLRGRLRDLADAPPSPGALLPDPRLLAPGAIVREAVAWATRDPGAIVDYVRRLRGMPPRQAAVRAAGDAGAVSADAAMEAAEYLLKRLILRGMSRAGAGSAAGEGVPAM